MSRVDEKVRVTVDARGHAYLYCIEHPGWRPCVTGDLISTVNEKVRLHARSHHGEAVDICTAVA